MFAPVGIIIIKNKYSLGDRTIEILSQFINNNYKVKLNIKDKKKRINYQLNFKEYIRYHPVLSLC